MEIELPEVILSIQKRLQKGEIFSPKEKTRLLSLGYSVRVDNLTRSNKNELEKIADEIHAELKKKYGGEYSRFYDYISKWDGYSYRERITHYVIREVLVGLKRMVKKSLFIECALFGTLKKAMSFV